MAWTLTVIYDNIYVSRVQFWLPKYAKIKAPLTLHDVQLWCMIPDVLLGSLGNVTNRDVITIIGEVLEATAHSCNDKPVNQGDVVAIQVAKVRATATKTN